MEMTPVTYYPVPLQRLWKTNASAIENKTYRTFFSSDLVVPLDVVRATQEGPATDTRPPTRDNINALFSNLDAFPRVVYGVTDDGDNGMTTYNINRHFLAGVTAAMMEWWFLWHSVEKERYSLWFPYARIDNSVADPARLSNTGLTYAERLYGNPNHIKEYIVDHVLDAIIHFTAPVELGLDKAVLEKQGLNFSASGWAASATEPDLPNTLMLHIGRDVAGGFELYTCYFIGAHTEWSRVSGRENAGKRAVAAAKASGMSAGILEAMSYEMAVHDMTEFTHLGQILPELYQRFSS